MFNYERSEIIHIENRDYKIFGDNYIVEFGVYHDKESEIMKFALLEEGFLNDLEVSKKETLTKTKELILNVLEDRKSTLELRSKL